MSAPMIVLKTFKIDGKVAKEYFQLALKNKVLGASFPTPMIVLRSTVENDKKLEVVGCLPPYYQRVRDFKKEDIEFTHCPFFSTIAPQLGIDEEFFFLSPSIEKSVLCPCCNIWFPKSKTKLCSCRHIRYCNERCQLAHWKEHKSSCTYKK